MARKQYPQDILWTQRDKTQIRLGHMLDSHIANCVRMLRRSADRLWDECAAGFGYGGNPDSMGSYYAEQAGNEAGDEAARIQDSIKIFMDELRRRYPNEQVSVRSNEQRLPRLRL